MVLPLSTNATAQQLTKVAYVESLLVGNASSLVDNDNQDEINLLRAHLEVANKNLVQLQHENKHLLSGTPFNEIPPLEDDSEQAKQADWTGEEPAIKDGEYDGTTPLVNVLSALIGYGKGNDARHRDVNTKIKSDLKITSKAKRLKPAENLIRLRHVQDNLTEYRELFSNKK